jgi:GT2 family glycosyltransferase
MVIVDRYRNRISNLRIEDASARKGQPFALNTGAAAAQGNALVFCDADDEVAPGWLQGMGEALEKYECVACRVDFTKLNPSWIAELWRDHSQCQQGLQKSWYLPTLWHAGGGTLGVRKTLYDAVGGFDDSLPYCHDTDFCFRAQLRGAGIYFVPEALLHVRGRHSLAAVFHQGRRWAEYTALLYKRYRVFTVERGSWIVFGRQVRRLLRSTPAIRHRGGRVAWFWNLGWQVGMLYGSVKHHVPPV